MIGIKVANGEFYPILEENTAASKRLVLTTAHDAQKSVQIDLFSSAEKSMESARYIGTLIVDNLQEKKQGDPSIDLVITSNADGEISAEAFDVDRKNKDERYNLSVSLSTLDSKIGEYNLNDLGDDFDVVEDGSNKVISTMADSGKSKKISSSLIIVTSALLFCAILLILWFFVFKQKIGEKNLRLLPQPTTQIVPQDEGNMEMMEHDNSEAMNSNDAMDSNYIELTTKDAAKESESSEIDILIAKADAESKEKKIVDKGNAPVTSNETKDKAPVTWTSPVYPVPGSGTSYKMRWGDTLWDVSRVYYHDPWYYKYLARYNRIANPNNVRAGRTIQIPPQPR
ncbi:MAG: LysM peptidoglycan-binding domain-containing protein [Termitinemataceae bacterium]|nr:MAG: LysM peptidoglycan-binding domain-containing protein [Termitinemataceae bacterium]